MKWSAIVALLVFALPAQAQMYKCVDARGKTQYSDKPIAGCRTEKTIEAAPPSRAAPAPAAAPTAQASAQVNAQAAQATPKATNAEAVAPSQLAARCQGLRDEQEWLNGAAGKAVAYHAERVAQVELALRQCR